MDVQVIIAIVVLALLIYLGVKSGGGAPAKSRKTAARQTSAKRPAARKAAKKSGRSKAKAKGRRR